MRALLCEGRVSRALLDLQGVRQVRPVARRLVDLRLHALSVEEAERVATGGGCKEHEEVINMSLSYLYKSHFFVAPSGQIIR